MHSYDEASVSRRCEEGKAQRDVWISGWKHVLDRPDWITLAADPPHGVLRAPPLGLLTFRAKHHAVLLLSDLLATREPPGGAIPLNGL